MKKIISIAFAALLAGFAISCQKENSLAEQNDAPVQYTFNISVNDQFGFDSDAATKGGSGPSYKAGWENGDKIFLFFKPTGESLLDRYATLTYKENSWYGAVADGQSSLGDGGTLSAVYVYKLGDVTPAYSDGKWTIATGNTFYNCQTGVSYTVSGNTVSASLSLVAPTDFVVFSIYGTSGEPLYCDKVKGWKNVAIGGDMTFSNATCTESIEGIENVANTMYKDFFGRIVDGGTSLNDETCKFGMEVNGKVYEHTATPSTDAISFKMAITTGSNPWTEVPTTGTAKATIGGSAVDVKWIQLWPSGPKFAEYNVGATSASQYGGLYCWGKTTDKDPYTYYKNGTSPLTGTDDTATNLWGNNWRMPTQAELTALIRSCNFELTTVSGLNGMKCTGKGAYASNSVFLPAAGMWYYGSVIDSGFSGYYWSSTPGGGRKACALFYSNYITVSSTHDRENGYSVRAVLAE